jgi:hypothetical protein
MIYDSNNPVDAQRAEKRFKQLIEGKKMFEITEKASRSLSQNNYLHMIISFLAIELGETSEYVKDMYYKLAANRDMFLIDKHDDRIGTVRWLRSSSTLTKEEMNLSIDRFRDFASKVCDVYLPEPNEEEFLKSIMVEINRNKKFI